MTDIAALKKSVVIDIKAIVVIAAKDGINIPQLNREYKEQNGCDIPFMQLGHTSLQNFLKSIPEVVRLVTRGFEIRIFPINDEKNAHLVKLVCRTSSKKSGKSKRSLRNYVSNYSRSSHTYSNYNRERFVQSSTNQVVKNQGSVPATSRENIEKVLSFAGVNGVEIDYFQTNFFQLNGINFNYTYFGFNSLLESLKSIPSIVTLRGNGAGKTYCISTAEIEKHEKLRATALKEQQMENYNLTSVQSKKPSPQQPKENFLSSVAPKTLQQQWTKSIVSNNNQEQELVGATSSNYYTDESVNETLKRKMQMVLEKHKDGLYVDDFSEAFEELHGEALDLEEIGYYNILELVHQFDDIFRLVRSNNPKEKEKIFDAKQPLSVIQEMNKKLDIPKDLIKIIEQILQTHPNGISLSRLEQLYNSNCKTKLPYMSLGFFSIESFVSKLMSFIPFVLFEENGSKKIKLPQQDKVNIISLEKSPEPTLTLPVKSQGLRESRIPADAATNEDQFLSQTLDEFQDLDKYFKVVIAEVATPSFFWFQIEGIHTTDALEILMNELEEVYNLPRGQEYMVPHNYFLLNIPCVGLYCGDWHRATMIGFPSSELVELLFVDYGTKWTVKREEVRLIKKKFMNFPTQAIKARLALLEPASNADVWSTSAFTRFMELTKNKNLLCKVLTLDYKKGVSILLCQQRDREDDIYINDILIKEGIAKKSEEETLELRSIYQEQIETPFYPALPAPPRGVSPQYFPEEIEMKKLFKAPPGLTQNPILQKLAAKALNNQNNDSMDSRSPTPTSVSGLPKFENPLLSRIPFRGPPISILQTATVAPNPISTSPKRVEMPNPNTLRSTSTTPISIKSPTSPSNLTMPTLKSSDYPTEGATNNLLVTTQVRYTKIVKFTKTEDGHLINHNNRLYLTTGDISFYIYGSDVLVKMFKKLKWDKDIEMTTIEEEQCPEMFKELRKNQVRGFTKLDVEKCSVTLLPLESCIKALQKIPRDLQELQESIQSVLDNFDPKDPYWKETSEDEDNETEEFIKKQLEVLEIKRRAITKTMSEQCGIDRDTHIAYTQIMEEYIYYYNISPRNQKVNSANEMMDMLRKALNNFSLKTNTTNSSVVSEPQQSAQKSVQAVAPNATNQTPIQARTVASSTNTNTGPPLVPNPQYIFSSIIPQAGMVFPNIQYTQQYMMQPTPHPFQRQPLLFGANNTLFNNIYYDTMNSNQ